ncbi:unnamed protein product [Bursaphelenchus xylophilus]|uniref:(pine wood nematode) hypothetical protein n=1 Tax=Bursaphelenchus xylophilus TaxID=6326 RepID=A0A1I7SLM5_BURXY|nr:unnamed protein product [Bursaphelenchus xylophilus]CAG9129672.1 unnamed protein product [Bursaphelenchus xylophilus]
MASIIQWISSVNKARDEDSSDSEGSDASFERVEIEDDLHDENLETSTDPSDFVDSVSIQDFDAISLRTATEFSGDFDIASVRTAIDTTQDFDAVSVRTAVEPTQDFDSLSLRTATEFNEDAASVLTAIEPTQDFDAVSVRTATEFNEDFDAVSVRTATEFNEDFDAVSVCTAVEPTQDFDSVSVHTAIELSEDAAHHNSDIQIPAIPTSVHVEQLEPKTSNDLIQSGPTFHSFSDGIQDDFDAVSVHTAIELDDDELRNPKPAENIEDLAPMLASIKLHLVSVEKAKNTIAEFVATFKMGKIEEEKSSETSFEFVENETAQGKEPELEWRTESFVQNTCESLTSAGKAEELEELEQFDDDNLSVATGIELEEALPRNNDPIPQNKEGIDAVARLVEQLRLRTEMEREKRRGYDEPRFVIDRGEISDSTESETGDESETSEEESDEDCSSEEGESSEEDEESESDDSDDDDDDDEQNKVEEIVAEKTSTGTEIENDDQQITQASQVSKEPQNSTQPPQPTSTIKPFQYRRRFRNGKSNIRAMAKFRAVEKSDSQTFLECIELLGIIFFVFASGLFMGYYQRKIMDKKMEQFKSPYTQEQVRKIQGLENMSKDLAERLHQQETLSHIREAALVDMNTQLQGAMKEVKEIQEAQRNQLVTNASDNPYFSIGFRLQPAEITENGIKMGGKQWRLALASLDKTEKAPAINRNIIYYPSLCVQRQGKEYCLYLSFWYYK